MKKVELVVREFQTLIDKMPGLSKVKFIIDDNSGSLYFNHHTFNIGVSDLFMRSNSFMKACNDAYYTMNKKIGKGTHKLHTMTYGILHEMGHAMSYSMIDEDLHWDLFNEYCEERDYHAPETSRYNKVYKAMINYYTIITELDANIYANLLYIAYKGDIERIDRIVRKLYPKRLTLAR